MSTILEKPIMVNRIIATTCFHAKALEDPARLQIMKILYHKQLTAEQILLELQKSGYNKALTTVRHHLDILKTAGLIEIVKIQEARGAITKFYGTPTKVLDFDIPKDFDSKFDSVVKFTSTKMEKLLKNLEKKTSSKTKNLKQSADTSNYNQYLMVEIMNRAMTNVLEKSNNKKIK